MSVLFPTSWDTPSAAGLVKVTADAPSKKRKRPSGSKDVDDIDLGKVEINIEKLMKKMQAEDRRANKDKEGSSKAKARKDDKGARKDERPGGGALKKKDKPKVDSRPNGNESRKMTEANGHASKLVKKAKGGQSNPVPPSGKDSEAAAEQKRKERPQDGHRSEHSAVDLVPAAGPVKESVTSGDAERPKKKLKKSRQSAPVPLESSTAPEQPAKAALPPQSKAPRQQAPPAPPPPTVDSTNLTPLQAKMKRSLDGARFRWINEQLYTSSSEAAHTLMKEQPNLYNDYHSGFAQQVTSWPTPPLTAIISSLTNLPKPALIADLGSGPASLARALAPKGYGVLSFDLVGDDWVVEADFCKRLPLPGKEDAEAQGSVVDVCVCALSLMSVNWIAGVREARRVMKNSGVLKVAEVTSRFTDLQAFIDLVCEVGFKMTQKDEKNTHFVLLNFEKRRRDALTEDEWSSIQRKAKGLLKPCEYKRR